jgi:hypothetical protein
MTIEQWATILTPLAVFVVLVMQRFNAVKVRSALKEATIKSDDKLAEIHGLVNGNLLTSKRTDMLQAQRIADLTKDDADHVLASAAQRAYEDALARQRRVESALGRVASDEHRIVLTDGPMIHVIMERLTAIEKTMQGLKCRPGDPTCDPVNVKTK